jgi:hypothetical protein
MGVFEIQAVAPVARLPPAQIGRVAASNAGSVGSRGRDAEIREDGREEIVAGHERVDRAAAFDASGMVPDHRDADRLFVHVERVRAVSLAPHAVMSGVPALIRREDDERILALAHFIELLEHPPETHIDTADEA